MTVPNVPDMHKHLQSAELLIKLSGEADSDAKRANAIALAQVYATMALAHATWLQGMGPKG